jgi:hypothetical protein
LGRIVPDVEFADGTRRNQCFWTGQALLVDFAVTRDYSARWPLWRSSPVRYRRCRRATVPIGRTDGVVAWASDAVRNEKEVADAVLRWLSVG